MQRLRTACLETYPPAATNVDTEANLCLTLARIILKTRHGSQHQSHASLVSGGNGDGFNCGSCKIRSAVAAPISSHCWHLHREIDTLHTQQVLVKVCFLLLASHARGIAIQDVFNASLKAGLTDSYGKRRSGR